MSRRNTIARFEGSSNYSWWDSKDSCKICHSHWYVKYRSRSLGQDACWVRMSRRNTMQGLKVLPTIVDEIARFNEIIDGWIDEPMDGKPDAYVTPCQQVRQQANEDVRNGKGFQHFRGKCSYNFAWPLSIWEGCLSDWSRNLSPFMAFLLLFANSL